MTICGQLFTLDNVGQVDDLPVVSRRKQICPVPARMFRLTHTSRKLGATATHHEDI